MGKETKYICKCYKVTESNLDSYISEGIKKYKELKKHEKWGSKCSKCKTRIKEYLKENS
jgi:bacterioferritin-associated ferredoxin